MLFAGGLGVAKRLLCAACLWGVLGMSAMAESPILTAPEAEAQVAAGDIVLLDIRSPQEWQDTGVAKGAWPVSMHTPDFGERLQAILAQYPAEQIALICATGGRTSHVVTMLNQNGIHGVADVSEGMMGNPRGPGWIARGMEVVPLDQATEAYDAAVKAWK